MRRSLLISILMMLISCAVASAQEDSLAVSDTVQMSDEEILKLLSSPQLDTVKKVVDRGKDVSGLVNSRRQRSLDQTPFSSTPFLANTFVSARLTTPKILTEDYGWGLTGGLSFGKWLHEDHAVRITGSYGVWQDNFDGASIRSMDLSASYLFNLSSYVGGYRTSRLCEIMVVSGLGYSNSMRNGELSHAFNSHVGFNINLRLFRNFDFFIEPLAKIYTNGMAVSYAGNWRSWLSSFETTCGLTYNIKRSKSSPSDRLFPHNEGWFISLLAGPHYHHAELVYDAVSVKRAMGIHVALGLGKYYTDFFAVRFSAAYSRGAWVIYNDRTWPCNYFSLRAEGMLDMVDLIRKASGKEGHSVVAASVLAGPEIGYMYKVDQDTGKAGTFPVITSAYVGITGGVQLKCRLTKRFSMSIEPRVSVMPYDAPYHNSPANLFDNYSDSIFNFNIGLEYTL